MYSSPRSSSGAMNFLQDNNDSNKKVSSGQRAGGNRTSDPKKKKGNAIEVEDEDEDALPIGKVLIRKGGKPIKRKAADIKTQIETESKIDESSLSTDSRVSRVSRFREGDMVWGKVKSHPWWPGQIFNPALATATAKRSRRSGHVLVAFFGDATFGWFVESNLIPFEPTFKEKSKQTVSRNFIEAVEDAVDELHRRAAVGLMCSCRNKFNYGSPKEGYVKVLVPGWEQPVVYPDRLVKEARNGFRPEHMLDFVKKMAVSPWCGENRTIAGIKLVGGVRAYRTATAIPASAKYREDLGIVQRRPGNVLEKSLASDQQFRYCEEGTQREAMAPFFVKDQKGQSNFVDGQGISIHEGQTSEKADSYLLKRRDRDVANEKQNSIIKVPAPNGIKKFKIDQGITLLGDAEESDDVSNYVFKKRSQQEGALAVENKIERNKTDQRLHGERHDLQEIKKRKRKNDAGIPNLEVQSVEKKEERKGAEQGPLGERHAIQEVKRRKRESTDQISQQEKEGHTVNRKHAEGRKKAKEALYKDQHNIQEKKERKNETPELTLHLEKHKPALKRRISETEALNDCLSNTNLELSSRIGMKLAFDDLNKESFSIQSIKSDAPRHEATEKLQKSLPNKKYRKTVEIGADYEDTTQIGQIKAFSGSPLITEHATPDEAGYVSRKADKSKNKSRLKDLVGGKILDIKSDKSVFKSLPKKKSAKALHIEKNLSGTLLYEKEAGGNILPETVEAGLEGLPNDKILHEKQSVDSGSSKPYTVDAGRNILNAKLQEGHSTKSDYVDVGESIGLTGANDAPEESELTTNENIQDLDHHANLTCNQLQVDTCDDDKLSLQKKPLSIAVDSGSDSSLKHVSEKPDTNPLNLNDFTNGQIGFYEGRGGSKVSELNLNGNCAIFDVDKCSSQSKENVDVTCLAFEASTYFSSRLSTDTNVVAGTDLVVAAQMDDVVCTSPNFKPTCDQTAVCNPEGFLRPGTCASVGVEDQCSDSSQVMQITVGVEDQCNDSSQVMQITVNDRDMKSSDKQAVGDVDANRYDDMHTSHLDGRGDSKENDDGYSDSLLVQVQGCNFYERSDSQFLHQLVKDLRSIATGPFHGIKWDCRVDLSRILLRFRSIVYEKIQESSYIADTSDNAMHCTGIEMKGDTREDKTADKPSVSWIGNLDGNGVDASRPSEAVVAAAFNLEAVSKLSNNTSQTNEAGSQAKESKKKKIVAWSDGHSKSSNKSYSSPEESGSKMSAKRHSGICGRDSREAVRYKKRSNQSSDARKTLEEPMALSMKFPQGFALPSEAQLKARFVRFGQLDISGTRIYCHTNCARVVFRCTSDAEAAYKYAMKNSLFGEANVKFKLKQMFPATKEAPLLQSGSESQNKGTETLQGNFKVSKERNNREEGPSAVPDVKFDLLEENIQVEPPKLPDTDAHDLCSLLPSDGPMPAEASDHCPLNEALTSPLIQLKSCLKKPDESGNLNIKESIRVTFLLDKEHKPDINDMKSGFSQNERSCDSVPVVGPQNSAVAPEPPDIFNQMMYLLNKCNEIVGDIRSSMGYVPYHLFSSSI